MPIPQDGNPIQITWDEIALDPGWCKLDWVFADPVRDELLMSVICWMSPGKPQMDQSSPWTVSLIHISRKFIWMGNHIPIFSKLSQHVSADALEEYVEQLEKEVNKYITKNINYGKAAKRMYNIFRLTGRYNEAAIIRELFDEPSSMLYQVWALIRTMEECSHPGSSITEEIVQSQADRLILEVVRSLEGDEESIVVQHLLNLGMPWTTNIRESLFHGC